MSQVYRGFRISKAQAVVLGLLTDDTWVTTTSIISSLLEKDVVTPAGAPRTIDGLIAKKMVIRKEGKLQLTENGELQKRILADLDFFK